MPPAPRENHVRRQEHLAELSREEVVLRGKIARSGLLRRWWLRRRLRALRREKRRLEQSLRRQE